MRSGRRNYPAPMKRQRADHPKGKVLARFSLPTGVDDAPVDNEMLILQIFFVEDRNVVLCAPTMWSVPGVLSAFAACFFLKLALGSPVPSEHTASMQEVPSVALKIKIPESTEIVDTTVAVDSMIPQCVKKDPESIEENGILTISAETFTECARQELGRIQDELEKQPESVPGVRGNKAEKSAEAPPSIRNHDQVNQHILAQHGIKNKENNAKEKGVAETVANATVEAVKATSNSNDMLSVLQTVFDYKRVMNDLRRILKGDVLGVLGEYPGRMNGLFKMVQELPRRIMKSIGIVNRLRTDTEDTTFRGFLTNLRDYLTQASQNAKALPDAFNMIGVVETLRNVAAKIGEGVHRRIDDAPAQRALLTRVEGVLEGAFAAGHAAVDQGAGRSILSRAISLPERFLPDGLHPRKLLHFHRQPYTEEQQQ